MLLFFWSCVLASELEKCLFDECNIAKAKEMPLVDPIDLSIKYFLTKTIDGNKTDALVSALISNINNDYTSLLISRSLDQEGGFKISKVTKNVLLRNVGYQIAKKFYHNKYMFKDPILLSNLNSKSDIKDILINVWTMDEVVLVKFYYLLESRLLNLKDMIKPLEFLVKKKQTYANIILGNCYLYGMGVEQNLDKALEYFYAGKSNKSDVSALVGIGRVMMERKSHTKEEIIQVFKEALAYASDAEANYYLFLLTQDDDDSKIFDEYNYLRDSAYAGYLPAVYKYSIVYANSNFIDASNSSLMSVTQFYPKFQELETKAIEAYQCKRYAQAAIIFLYLSEFNLSNAVVNAIFILEKHNCLDDSDRILLEKYNVLAQTNPKYFTKVGDMYYYGKGAPQSYVDAFSFYLAAKKNSDEGAYNLAYMYEHGLGVPRNLQQAAKIIKKYVTTDTAYLVYYYALFRVYFKIIVANMYIVSAFATLILGFGTSFFVYKSKILNNLK